MTRHMALLHPADGQADDGSTSEAVRSTDTRLRTVTRDRLWRALALSPAQLAQLTGISRRLALRWVAMGLLTPHSLSPMRFDGTAVEQAIMIRQALARGHSLEQVAWLARQNKRRMPGGVSIADTLNGDSSESFWVVQDFIEAALNMALLDLRDASDISSLADGSSEGLSSSTAGDEDYGE